MYGVLYLIQPQLPSYNLHEANYAINSPNPKTVEKDGPLFFLLLQQFHFDCPTTKII